MTQILQTIDEYIVKERKRDTFWLVFNTVYNDIHAFNKKLNSEDAFSLYLDKKNTDYTARDEFTSFMQTNFPDVKLVEVFDLVNAGYLEYPYLGSIAIDCDEDSEVYKALCEKYGNPYDDTKVNNAVFWVIPYEEAKKFYDEKVEFLDAEFGEE